jgi:hypothetical protein
MNGATPAVGVRAALDHGAVSGSRLKARRWVGPDGAVQHIEWFDTTLGLPCFFAYGNADQRYCLPNSHWSNLYADAQCSEAIVKVDPCNRDAERVRGQETRGCDALPRFLEVGEATTLERHYYQDAPGKPCVEHELPPGTKFRRVGKETPLSTFVSARREAVSLGEGFEAKVLVGSDGSLALEGVYDLQRKGKCTPEQTEAGIRCVPVRGGFGGTGSTFADAACTRPVGGAALEPDQFAQPWDWFPNCETSTVAVTHLRPSCRRDLTFHELGPRLGEIMTYSNAGGTCQPSAASAEAYELGARIPATAFPRVVGRSEGGRIRTHFYTAGGVHLRGWSPALWDTQLDRPCEVREVSDGSYRCVPLGALGRPFHGERFYADAGCTQRAFRDDLRLCNSGDPPYARETQARPGDCGVGQVLVYRLGDKIFGDTIYAQPANGGACIRRTIDHQQHAYYLVEREIPPGELARFEQRE